MVKILSKWEAPSSSSLIIVLMDLKNRPDNRQCFDANSNTLPTLLKTFAVAGEREGRFWILVREFAGSSSSHLSFRCFDP